MRKRNENRHGVTLVELVVVLAILSIVTTMVVSFNVIVNQRRAESQAKLEVLQDVRVAEAMIESWINSTKIASITDGSAILTSREDEKNIVKFNDGVLTVGKNTITLDRVTGISFEEITSNNDRIYFCTITYEISGSRYDYTFCVDPYISIADTQNQ